MLLSATQRQISSPKNEPNGRPKAIRRPLSDGRPTAVRRPSDAVQRPSNSRPTAVRRPSDGRPANATKLLTNPLRVLVMGARNKSVDSMDSGDQILVDGCLGVISNCFGSFSAVRLYGEDGRRRGLNYGQLRAPGG